MALSYRGLMVLQVDYAAWPSFMSQTANYHATLMKILPGFDSTHVFVFFFVVVAELELIMKLSDT